MPIDQVVDLGVMAPKAPQVLKDLLGTMYPLFVECQWNVSDTGGMQCAHLDLTPKYAIAMLLVGPQVSRREWKRLLKQLRKIHAEAVASGDRATVSIGGS